MSARQFGMVGILGVSWFLAATVGFHFRNADLDGKED